MRIRKSDKAGAKKPEVKIDLQAMDGRMALSNPVCSPDCQKFHASACSAHCSDAPALLSSDPAYPVEVAVAPLVFALKQMGVFDPCWSCEGHYDTSGNLWKLPRVWFYADSVVHVRVLSHAIKDMFHKGRISHNWEVSVTHSDDNNLATTFSLQPVLADGENSLGSLHRDIEAITQNLHAFVRKQVNLLQENL